MIDKKGADLVHVVCDPRAATVIKSYSPELMVYPYLRTLGDSDHTYYREKAVELLGRMHAVVIGPGLGRHCDTLQQVQALIFELKRMNMPIILDAVRMHYIKLY